MKEKQFLSLPAQGNIYSTARLGNLILIGSGNFGKILVYSDTMITTLDELTLTTVPNGVDIIALETVPEIPGTGPMLGLTYIQKTLNGIEEIKTGYLNIYADCLSRLSQSNSVSTPTTSSGSTPRSSLSSSPVSTLKRGGQREHGFTLTRLEVLCQRCVSFKLAFIPYHLYHVGNVFLLSASDHRIYAYEPTEDKTSFAHIPIQKHFPELEGQFPSVVTRVQVETIYGLRKRITLVGCEDGSLRTFIFSNSGSPSSSVFATLTPGASSPRSGIAPRVKLVSGSGDAADGGLNVVDDVFAEVESGSEVGDLMVSSMNDDIELDESCQRYCHQFDGMITSIQVYTDGCSVNAIVSSANSPVYVYTNVLEDCFEKGHALRFSGRWDCVEAICVADLDFDGQAEIAIGTFGCTLLIYKFMEEMQQWVIVSNRKFPSAIFHIEFANYQLHVVTSIGLHIIEYSTDAYFLKRGLIPSGNMENALARLDLDDHEEEARHQTDEDNSVPYGTKQVG